MLYIDLTKLCNWAKGIAKCALRLNGPYNPNLIVPQLWVCKMGIMPPCHRKMTLQINLPVFVNSLNPKLWVFFLPCSARESELSQAVLVPSQLSCPARNACLTAPQASLSVEMAAGQGCWEELPGATIPTPTLLSKSYLQKEDSSEGLKPIFVILCNVLCLTTPICLKITVVGQE